MLLRRGAASSVEQNIHKQCNPLTCPAYASGWCEYDPITDTIYPCDGGECQEKSSEEEEP